ncbi:uncharacterized protein J4E88_007935 [Alternaria novae-zelandiae]|uniref:uncharacterized protein n=1 Tax=Alternaria metachromatica TaxID=283354 RepID=UPI0020C4AEEC|nr:uncharacterized protein J4E83_003678 [Alternaria metachromatica]XP_049252622.1 uncharacterized protein J4E88_007935 [Alternaria novae-zelandiae]KAI4626527.1 hypothetical protein J4E83_003678 [Alternaria metachromatica]KAI4675031.1 hypothetical protein J4E88_007935 [Alternaria novae-zelandiae]
MYTQMLFSAFLATSLAAPLVQRQSPKTGASDSWQPASDTITTCDPDSPKLLSFTADPKLDTILNNACAAMMPGCAYPDRIPTGTLCTATVDYPLNGDKNSTQDANVVGSDGNRITDYAVRFDVTPASQPEDSAGVFWKVEDCYGYFARMLQKEGKEGCHNSVGSGSGNVTVGGDSSLAGTIFKVSIVPTESLQ